MQLDEIKHVNKLAGKKGDLESAALKFLGLETKAGSECAVNGIVDEVRQYNEADAETRAGIEAYKAAKEHVETDDPAGGDPDGENTGDAESEDE